MASLTIKTPTGADAGSVDVADELFGIEPNPAVMHQVVTAQLAARRAGTHSTKTRGEVSGGGAKPWRQKGTGRARQGSRRAPQWTGGGVVHGPKPRDYAQRTPKKMVAAALRGALSDRARGGRVHVVSSVIEGDNPSTRTAIATLAAAVGAESLDRRILVALHRDEDLAWLSLRNVPEVHAIAVDQLNAYDVLCNDDIVFTQAALEAFVAGPARGKSVKSVATESEAATESETEENTK